MRQPFNGKKLAFLETKGNAVTLSPKHKYYTQVQMQMRCTGRQWCDFFVWWPKGSFTTRIFANKTYQDKAIAKCEEAFFDILLPTAIVNASDPTQFCAESVVDLSKVSDFHALRNEDVKALVFMAK